MEDVQPHIIPTLSRAKISRHLSYPVGASAISLALASTAQLPQVKLRFYFWSNNPLRQKHYEFMRVEYLNNATPVEGWHIWRLYRRPPQYRWEIVVQPVPRSVRHRTNQYILGSALPQIATWLSHRAQLAQQGSDMLTFSYDEETDEFVVRPITKLEPLREKQQ